MSDMRERSFMLNDQVPYAKIYVRQKPIFVSSPIRVPVSSFLTDPMLETQKNKNQKFSFKIKDKANESVNLPQNAESGLGFVHGPQTSLHAETSKELNGKRSGISLIDYEPN